MITVAQIESPLGPMTAAAVPEGLCLLEFSSGSRAEKNLAAIAELSGEQVVKGESEIISDLKKELGEYFSGSRKEFTVPLKLFGTDFRKRVWNELLTIKYGTTRSYLEQSKNLGTPAAIRAIANANGSNPVAIIVPCHRVIGSDGSLTGYGGGLEKKRWLLDHEKRYSGHPVELTFFNNDLK